MHITFLGTCSGTEPMPGRCHVSWTIEQDGNIYWFDAGDGCARHGHLRGMDLTTIRAIFISHSHMDHVGGLPELLWTIRKLNWVKRQSGVQLVDVHYPNQVSWDAILAMLFETECGRNLNFTLRDHLVTEGPVYDDGLLSVEAITNGHLPDGKSKSYRIRHAGRTIVFSGDVGSVDDMRCWFEEPVDLLLMETGHHKVDQVCEYVKGKPAIRKLGFIHHGRAILRDYEGQLALARSILGEKVFITNDGETMDL